MNSGWWRDLQTWQVILLVVALLQPYVILLLLRFFKRPKVKMYKHGNLSIGFQSDGCVAGISGTIRALNRDVFVSSIRLRVTHEETKEEHRLEWWSWLNSAVSEGKQITMYTNPVAFMLMIWSPRSGEVHFRDAVTQRNLEPVLARIGDKWDKFSRREPSLTIEDFRKSQAGREFEAEIARECYWRKGRYRLVAEISTEEPKKMFESRWTFELSEEDVNALHANSALILDYECGGERLSGPVYVDFD